MAEPRTNRLASSASAYLKSAAHQPVDWFPWGEEAFARARETTRPILLDIGAVWCHWCHVIDRESYEDPALAGYINEHFVPVKVDRDERPDVDRRYQKAVMALTGQGGWPLTGFLTPEGKIFYGGTYFPPVEGTGRPSFRRVLESIASAFEKNRSGVQHDADALFQALEEDALRSRGEPPPLDEIPIRRAVNQMQSNFDAVNGGFETAPKFPHPAALRLLFYRRWETGEEDDLQSMAVRTLKKMAEGGVHDQLGGGFHRYSTDEQWIVPHFEKMSYDNSELLRAYAEGFAATRDPLHREVAQGIIRFVREVLSDPERGGFFASQDADVGLDDDGDYFTWSKAEVEEVLSPEEARVAEARFDVGVRGEMQHNPEKNVLWAARSPELIAEELKMGASEVRLRLAAATAKLREARGRRRAPFVDATLYANWNGLMASAFLQAEAFAGIEGCRDFALKSLERVWGSHAKPGEGMAHTVQEGGRRVGIFADDQFKFSAACLDAFEATGEGKWLERARALVDFARERFEDREGGGFFDIAPGAGGEAPPLGRGEKPLQDDPAPSTNAVAAEVMDRLFAWTGDPKLREGVERTLRAFAGVVENYGLYAAAYDVALMRFLRGGCEIVVVGAPEDAKARSLYKAAQETWRPFKAVLALDGTDERGRALLSPAIRAMGEGGRGARAFVCAGGSCAPPVEDPAALEELVRSFGRSRG